jgi:hypothetical protein
VSSQHSDILKSSQLSEKTYHSENLPLPVRQAGYNPSLPSGLEALWAGGQRGGHLSIQLWTD